MIQNDEYLMNFQYIESKIEPTNYKKQIKLYYSFYKTNK
jgi:hypothetical protein